MLFLFGPAAAGNPRNWRVTSTTAITPALSTAVKLKTSAAYFRVGAFRCA